MTANDINKTLSLDDVMCPVCLDIVIEPVTMSCAHELCKECYMEHFKSCDFFCPICKKRLSTWARKAIANGTLVNEKKWSLIKKEYPDLIENKERGIANLVFLQEGRQHIDIKVANPGEVNAEYVEMRQQWLVENSVQKQSEEEASLRLVKQLLEEEKREAELAKRLQQEADKKLALRISKELEIDVSPSKVNKVILRPRQVLTPINRNRGECSSASTQSASKPKKVTARKRKRCRSEEF